MPRWQKIVISLAVALFALPLGALLAPPLTQSTSLGDLRFQLEPAAYGGGELYVPVADWGMNFNLHSAPFVLRSELRSINREGLLGAASGDETILSVAEKEIRQGAIASIFRTFLWAILIAAIAGLVLARFWPKLSGIQALTSLVTALLGALIIIASLATHSPSALERPSFFARGAELEQILDALSREGESGGYQNNFRRVLADVSAFLAESPVPRASGEIEAVMASDLHTNALALPALGDLAEGKPVFFVGDFSLEGNDQEAALLADQVASLGSRVIAVSGNHDSSSLMLALAQSGVEVLSREGVLLPDGTWTERKTFVDSLLVMGWDDPLEWSGEPSDPSRVFSLDSSTRASAERELLSWWRSLKDKPDVLLLHQNGLAEYLAKQLKSYPRPLTILTGHDHKQWVARKGNIRIIDAGSVGAGGIFGFGRETAEMAEIYFSPVSSALQTADMIEISPLDGRASAERVVLGEICQLPCRYKLRPMN